MNKSFVISLIAHALAFLVASICDVSIQAADAKLPPPEHPLELRDGERVTLVGGTFIERMQTYGYLETLLTAAHPERDIMFRNLGWSGDNVWGVSRALFGTPKDGFQRLLDDVRLTEPTLLIVCYGENEAHAATAGIDDFRNGLTRLLDELRRATAARIVLLGPRKHENLGPPLPAQDAYNAQLDEYIGVTRTVAEQRELPFVDLNRLLPVEENRPLTTNGVHLGEAGYRAMAVTLARRLSPGRDVPSGLLDEPRGQKLRRLIGAKNELFFHRYRPQNETYLFLFRKHEQGNNAVEIPQFDPLVEDKEKEIAELRKQ